MTTATAPGAPCWIDLSTPDVERARSFYPALFGWTVTEPVAEFGGYFQFLRNGAPVGGCVGPMPEQPPANVWSVYLLSDNAEKTVALAEGNGGRILAPAMTVGDLGTMAVLVDNAGAVIGVWQPIGFSGIGSFSENGAPGWFELHTAAYGDSVEFYRTVFGWNVQTAVDTPEFHYSVLVDGDKQLAGVMDSSVFTEDVPTRWNVYFTVDSADDTAARCVSLGGSVVQEPEDTPYGRLATLADPSGATFKLLQPPAGV